MLAQFNSSPVGNSPCGVWPSFRRSQGCISSGWCHRLVMLHASIHAETDSQLVPASLSPSPSPSLSASLSLSLRPPGACSLPPPPVPPPPLSRQTKGGSCQTPRPRVQESPNSCHRHAACSFSVAFRLSVSVPFHSPTNPGASSSNFFENGRFGSRNFI